MAVVFYGDKKSTKVNAVTEMLAIWTMNSFAAAGAIEPLRSAVRQQHFDAELRRPLVLPAATASPAVAASPQTGAATAELVSQSEARRRRTDWTGPRPPPQPPPQPPPRRAGATARSPRARAATTTATPRSSPRRPRSRSRSRSPRSSQRAGDPRRSSPLGSPAALTILAETARQVADPRALRFDDAAAAAPALQAPQTTMDVDPGQLTAPQTTMDVDPGQLTNVPRVDGVRVLRRDGRLFLHEKDLFDAIKLRLKVPPRHGVAGLEKSVISDVASRATCRRRTRATTSSAPTGARSTRATSRRRRPSTRSPPGASPSTWRPSCPS